MAAKRPRSVFWIVSTHVLTSGFVMPLLAYVIFYVVMVNAGTVVRSGGMFAEAGMLLAMLSLGYVGGVFYSLSYIRKVAIIERPLACITPSIITFAVLSALALAKDIAMNPPSISGPWLLGLIAFYYAGITAIFGVITRNGFRKMAAEQQPRGFPVEPIRR